MPADPTPNRSGARVTRSSRRRRLAAVGVAVGLAGALSVGCAKTDSTASGKDGKGGKGVKISLTDDGCRPTPAKTGAGPTTFTVTNEGANGVTEAELQTSNGKSILGERENLTPGLNGSFSLTLAEGTYRIYCPGAKQDAWTFTVSGGQKVSDWKDNPALVKAVNGYADYVDAQAAELVTATKAFVAAVDAGDIDAAKKAYVVARAPYERIEPVAESFGDLDPRIDGRLGDNGNAPEDFIGFHRIEEAMWADDTLDGMKPVAATLMSDVEKLQKLINAKAKTYQPNEVTNGAVELLNEMLTSKISGEEERYSHTDLADFQENFDGSMETITLLRGVLKKAAPDLLDKIDAQAEKLQTELDTFKATPGVDDSGFVAWSCATDDQGEVPEGCVTTNAGDITPAQRRKLADTGKPLADLLAQVPTKVVR